MDEKQFLKMICSTYMLVLGNQIKIMQMLYELHGIPKTEISHELIAVSCNHIEMLKKQILDLDKKVVHPLGGP